MAKVVHVLFWLFFFISIYPIKNNMGICLSCLRYIAQTFPNHIFHILYLWNIFSSAHCPTPTASQELSQIESFLPWPPVKELSTLSAFTEAKMLCWIGESRAWKWLSSCPWGESARKRKRKREDVYALSGVSALWDRKPQPGSGTNTQLEPAVRSLPAGIGTQTGRLSESLIIIVFDSSELFTDYLEDSVKGKRKKKCQESARRHQG